MAGWHHGWKLTTTKTLSSHMGWMLRQHGWHWPSQSPTGGFFTITKTQFSCGVKGRMTSQLDTDHKKDLQVPDSRNVKMTSWLTMTSTQSHSFHVGWLARWHHALTLTNWLTVTITRPSFHVGWMAGWPAFGLRRSCWQNAHNTHNEVVYFHISIFMWNNC